MWGHTCPSPPSSTHPCMHHSAVHFGGMEFGVLSFEWLWECTMLCCLLHTTSWRLVMRRSSGDVVVHWRYVVLIFEYGVLIFEKISVYNAVLPPAHKQLGTEDEIELRWSSALKVWTSEYGVLSFEYEVLSFEFWVWSSEFWVWSMQFWILSMEVWAWEFWVALGTWTSSRVMFNVPTDCILTGFEAWFWGATSGANSWN